MNTDILNSSQHIHPDWTWVDYKGPNGRAFKMIRKDEVAAHYAAIARKRTLEVVIIGLIVIGLLIALVL